MAIHSLPDIGMSDPNNTAAHNQNAGGKTKINPTDNSGVSGQPTGSSYAQSLPSEKAWYPTAGSSGFNTSKNAPESNYANTSANTLYNENNTARKE